MLYISVVSLLLYLENLNNFNIINIYCRADWVSWNSECWTWNKCPFGSLKFSYIDCRLKLFRMGASLANIDKKWHWDIPGQRLGHLLRSPGDIFNFQFVRAFRHNGPESSYEPGARAGPSWEVKSSGSCFGESLAGRPGLEAWLLASSHKIGNNFTVIRQRIFNQNKKHLVAGDLFSFTWVAVNMESVTAQVTAGKCKVHSVLTEGKINIVVPRENRKMYLISPLSNYHDEFTFCCKVEMTQ